MNMVYFLVWISFLEKEVLIEIVCINNKYKYRIVKYFDLLVLNCVNGRVFYICVYWRVR